jgi:hypothetical protein
MSEPMATAAALMPTWSAYSWNRGIAPASSDASMRGADTGGGANTSTSIPVKTIDNTGHVTFEVQAGGTHDEMRQHHVTFGLQT